MKSRRHIYLALFELIMKTTRTETALDYLLSHRLLEKTTVILYGQSIGGAIAVDLASRNQDRVRISLLKTGCSCPSLLPDLII